jgi:hypothetical protein
MIDVVARQGAATQPAQNASGEGFGDSAITAAAPGTGRVLMVGHVGLEPTTN